MENTVPRSQSHNCVIGIILTLLRLKMVFLHGADLNTYACNIQGGTTGSWAIGYTMTAAYDSCIDSTIWIKSFPVTEDRSAIRFSAKSSADRKKGSFRCNCHDSSQLRQYGGRTSGFQICS